MKYKTHIESIGVHHAPNEVSSEWIENQLSETMDRLNIPEGKLERLTGVRYRRYWNQETVMYEQAVAAARKAIDAAGIDPGEIGCLVNTSVCRDYLEPAQACLIHGELGLSPDCLTFDITNACLGFVNGMDTVRRMVETGVIKYGLVVTAEGSLKAFENVINILKQPDCDMATFMQYLAMLTIGSGAVAMILSRDDVASSSHVINDSVYLTDTSNGNNRLCFAFCDHSQMIADAHGILVNGLPLVKKTWEKAEEKIPGWNDENIDLYIPHQTSSRQIREVGRALGMNLDKIHVILEKYGNAISAALPLTLYDAYENNRMKPGDHVALMGVGSGLNCMLMSVTW